MTCASCAIILCLLVHLIECRKLQAGGQLHILSARFISGAALGTLGVGERVVEQSQCEINIPTYSCRFLTVLCFGLRTQWESSL